MAGYLDEYGVADARRNKVIAWIVGSVVLVGLLAITGYFVLRTWPAKSRVSAFLEALQKHDYQAAYGFWSRSDYPYKQFLEDWGPSSPFASASAARITKSRYCDDSSIVWVAPQSGKDVALGYQRSSGTLGFWPWPEGCPQRFPAPSTGP